MGNCCNLNPYPDIRTYPKNSGPRILIPDGEDDSVDNNIKIKISTNGSNPITMTINQRSLFSEVKKKYCLLTKKNEDDLIIFVYKGKTLDENESLYSLGINEGITIAAFDSNDYKI